MFGLRVVRTGFFALLSACAAGAAAGCSAETDTKTAEAPIDECVGTTSSAVKVCAAGPTLQGIDVSYYQDNVDWTKVKADGQSFAFVRVSDGIDYPDSKFAQNWPALKQAGLVRGLYQFFRPTKDVTAQVNLLNTKLAAAGGLQPGDLPPVLDLESDGGLPAATVVARAKDWLAQVEAKYGVKPIVYTAAFMSNVIGQNFSSYTLWVANYQTSCPTMPSGWSDWHFWQNSDKGKVNGVSTPVDTNFFNGTLPELQALTLKGAPVSEPDDVAVFEPSISSASGYQGETIGSSKTPESVPFNPCR
jgi:lysozyme